MTSSQIIRNQRSGRIADLKRSRTDHTFNYVHRPKRRHCIILMSPVTKCSTNKAASHQKRTPVKEARPAVTCASTPSLESMEFKKEEKKSRGLTSSIRKTIRRRRRSGKILTTAKVAIQFPQEKNSNRTSVDTTVSRSKSPKTNLKFSPVMSRSESKDSLIMRSESAFKASSVNYSSNTNSKQICTDFLCDVSFGDMNSDSVLESLDSVEKEHLNSKCKNVCLGTETFKSNVNLLGKRSGTDSSQIPEDSGIKCASEDLQPFKTVAVKSPCHVSEFSALNDSKIYCMKPGGDFNSTSVNGTITSFLDALDDVFNELGSSPQLKSYDTNAVAYKSLDDFYGLPILTKSILKDVRGIERLYEWQENCLNLKAVTQRKNLIYSLPTSGGKTLVAEILIMRELLCNQKDVILVLPYVSIVQEKVRSLSPFATDLGFHIEEYAASKGCIPPKKRRKRKSVYIATIEKANALVNSLIEMERIDDLGLVVVDELHMIGDGSGRGATLEMCLSKLRYKSEKIQIVGMSATLGNIEDLQEFLQAEIFKNDFRPIQLREYMKLNDNLYEVTAKGNLADEEKYKFIRKINHPEFLDKSLWSRDNDHLLALVMEVIPEHSCLIFCPTKVNCQNVAMMLSKSAPRTLKEHRAQEKAGLLKEIKNNVNVVCPVLLKTIPYGMAYHHSGLTMDERKLIEDAYSAGVLCLLCCTSTLAAGVNLPAKRVILRAPYVAAQFLSRSRYKQMVGRAGRAGIDSSGESIVIIQQKDKVKIRELLSGPPDECRSSLLFEDAKGLRALILTLIGLKICTKVEDVVIFLQGTLYYVQNHKNSDFDVRASISNEITHLRNLGLVEIKKKGQEDVLHMEVTELGRATFKGCLDVDRTPLIYQELKRGIEKLVLLNDLHLLYLCTPLDSVNEITINWQIYYKQVSRLRTDEIACAEIIGIPEGFLARKSCGQRCGKNEADDFVLRRFYLTLMIQQLINEVSVWRVATRFNVSRGFLQNLLSSTTSFASLLCHFTNELKEFWALKLLIEAIMKKLSYTSSLELVPLLEIPGVKQARAKQLFKSGYHSLSSVAWADPEMLMKKIEHLPRKQAKLIVSSAKMLLQEKAEALKEEAEEMIAGPLDMELRA